MGGLSGRGPRVSQGRAGFMAGTASRSKVSMEARRVVLGRGLGEMARRGTEGRVAVVGAGKARGRTDVVRLRAREANGQPHRPAERTGVLTDDRWACLRGSGYLHWVHARYCPGCQRWFIICTYLIRA